MTPLEGGRRYTKSMDSQKRLTRLSFQSKEAYATFVNDLLTRLGPDDTLQLTTAIRPGGYVACCVMPVTTGLSDILSKMIKTKPDAS
jgi:hypothetical protein